MTLWEEALAAGGDFQNIVICCLCKSGTQINLAGWEGSGMEGRGGSLGEWTARRGKEGPWKGSG